MATTTAAGSIWIIMIRESKQASKRAIEFEQILRALREKAQKRQVKPIIFALSLSSFALLPSMRSVSISISVCASITLLYLDRVLYKVHVAAVAVYAADRDLIVTRNSKITYMHLQTTSYFISTHHNQVHYCITCKYTQQLAKEQIYLPQLEETTKTFMSLHLLQPTNYHLPLLHLIRPILLPIDSFAISRH